MLPSLEQARRHLDTIYDVSTLCARLEPTLDTIPGILRAIETTVPVRSAILYDGSASPPRAAGWRIASGIAGNSFSSACSNLQDSVLRLLGSSALVPKMDVTDEMVLSPRHIPVDGEQGTGTNYAVMPLTIGREPFGAFQIETTRRMTELDLALLAATTNQIALALARDHTWEREVAAREQAQRLQRLQEDLLLRESAARADAEVAHRRLAFLAEASRLATGSFDYAALLPRIAQIALREMADVCAIDVPETPPAVPIAVRVSHVAAQGAHEIEDALQRIVAKVFASGQVYVASAECENLAMPLNIECRKVLRKAGIRSVLAIPLRAKGSVLGVLSLYSVREDRYSPADLFVAEDLGQRLSSALEAGRLYRQATATIRDRDRLLEVVSQDLRGPLAQMLLTATAAKDKRNGDDLRKDLEVLRAGAAGLGRTLVDLLDSAQAENCTLRIEPADVHLSVLVEKAAAAVRPAIAEKKLKLDIRVRRSANEIFADPQRIEQVLAALLANAAQSSATGGTVTLQAQRVEKFIRVVVSDAGKAIPAADLPHLFDRFWRARNAKRIGPDLGLPIAKGLVEAHGGLMWVESAEGKGTTFTFSMPVR